MFKIQVDTDIRDLCPELKLGCILSDIKNTEHDALLWEKINAYSKDVNATFTHEKIRNIVTIKDTKQAYKKIGKDPNRYRPSAESLLRRLVKGQGLYQINTAVDILNFVSLRTGFSIGGYDFDEINGDIVFTKGGDQHYEGIGRGILNIDGLPVFFDKTGPFGSPTSDSLRTQVSVDTSRYLMLIISFSEKDLLEKAINESVKLLQVYCGASIHSTKVVE